MKASALLEYHHINPPMILRIPAKFGEAHEVFFEQESLTSDLHELANALYLVSSYHKDVLDLQIETENKALWIELVGDIEKLVEFLAHLKIRLDIVEASEPRKYRHQMQFGIDNTDLQNRLVALFSGGADSTAGIVNLSGLKNAPVMHHSLTGQIVYGRVKKLHNIMPLANSDLFLTDMRGERGVGSSSLRGFLFLVNAFLLCHFLKSDTLVFPENGPLMLNPPMSSFMEPTKNSHPMLISTLQRVFERIEGKKFKIYCIFKDKTKSEVMAPLLRDNLVAKTNSCFQVQGIKNMCGTCFACFVRKFSLMALGSSEPTYYAQDPFLSSCTQDASNDIMLDLHDSLFFLYKIIIDKADITQYLANVPSDFFANPSQLFNDFSEDIFLGINEYFMTKSGSQFNALGRFAKKLLDDIDRRRLESRKEQLNTLVKNTM